jgi:hypothetical protein
MKANAGLFLLLALTSTTPAFAGQHVKEAERVQLQATMQSHIEASMVSGAVLDFDESTGEINELYPSTAHPMILSMGDKFILCTDFLDANGRQINADYYVAREGEGFVVFHTAYDRREVVEKLMKDGKAEMLN